MTNRFVRLLSIAAASTVLHQAVLAQTVQQAESGRTVFGARCSSCHGVDLGGGEGPQLAGANFLAGWGTRSPRELIAAIRTTMPPAEIGSLDEDSVRQSRGVHPGGEWGDPRQSGY